MRGNPVVAVESSYILPGALGRGVEQVTGPI